MRTAQWREKQGTNLWTRSAPMEYCDATKRKHRYGESCLQVCTCGWPTHSRLRACPRRVLDAQARHLQQTGTDRFRAYWLKGRHGVARTPNIRGSCRRKIRSLCPLQQIQKVEEQTTAVFKSEGNLPEVATYIGRCNLHPINLARQVATVPTCQNNGVATLAG